MKEKDREKKKKKDLKNHKLQPVSDIVRENGDVISPQKGNVGTHCRIYLKIQFMLKCKTESPSNIFYQRLTI